MQRRNKGSTPRIAAILSGNLAAVLVAREAAPPLCLAIDPTNGR